MLCYGKSCVNHVFLLYGQNLPRRDPDAMEFTDITFSPVDLSGYEDPDSSTEKHREHPPTV